MGVLLLLPSDNAGWRGPEEIHQHLDDAWWLKVQGKGKRQAVQ